MATRTIGLSGLSVYLPPYRVDLERWCDWTGAEWEKIRHVVGTGFRLLGPQQSIYTMAANAVLRLIKHYDIDPAKVRYLALGTESSTDNSAAIGIQESHSVLKRVHAAKASVFVFRYFAVARQGGLPLLSQGIIHHAFRNNRAGRIVGA